MGEMREGEREAKRAGDYYAPSSGHDQYAECTVYR